MNAIEITDFTKLYKSQKAVDGLSMNVPEKAFFGLLGPNGAGKTTIVNFLAGLIRRDRGTLHILGQEIRDDSYEYKRKTGFVLEIPTYIEKLTGEEYLKFTAGMRGLGKKIADARSEELFVFLGLSDSKNKLIENYSQGMKKKILLAAAIIHDPELLVLDEPFEGIDPISAKLIRDNLKLMISKGKTILLTSHNLDIVEKLCTEVAIVNMGALVFQGSTSSIREKFEQGKGRESGALEELFLKLTYDGRQVEKLSWLE
jgi:ABC-2 type transport system ATP-binding protein